MTLSYRLIQFSTVRCSQVYTIMLYFINDSDVGRRLSGFTCNPHNCLETSINWPTIVAIVHLHATCHVFISHTYRSQIHLNQIGARTALQQQPMDSFQQQPQQQRRLKFHFKGDGRSAFCIL